MATLPVPSPGLGSASLGGSIHRPLSTHGLPKQPRTMSSERSHRCSAKSYPPPASIHTPITPRSLGPMSPPLMSAKSFGTFIDSEPSTPAYSPRMDHEWDDSSVDLVRPMSSSSEPTSPTEPVWRMLQPLPAKAPAKPRSGSTLAHSKQPAITAKEFSSQQRQIGRISHPNQFKLADLSQQDYVSDHHESAKEEEQKHEEQSAGTPTTATFGKLASKMKLMLRRKNTDAKKKEKKKRVYEEVDKIEAVHWTEIMLSRRWGGAVRLKCPVQKQLTTRLRTPLAATTKAFQSQADQSGRVRTGTSSRASQQARHLERFRHGKTEETAVSLHSDQASQQQHIVDPSIILLHSAFPKKTFIALLLVAGLAYYFIDTKTSDWTDAAYAAYSKQDDVASLASALHFYNDTEELQHILDHHIPDPSSPFKDPSIAKFISDQFDHLCFGWMMTEEDAKRGVEGMPGVHMPITHGCRVRSNEPCEDFFAVGISPGPGEKLWNYWTVLDGHAGKHTALVLTWDLIPRVSSALSSLASTASSPEIETAMKNAFLAVDKSIMDRAKTAANWFPAANAAAVAALTPAFSGSCALLAAFDPDTSTLRVACTGDSRAVLGRWDPDANAYTALPLSVDQTGFNKAEVERLTALHPDEPSMLDPSSGRLLGIAVTRAFGDHRWKWDNETIKSVQYKFWGPAPRPNSKTPPYMTAEPEVTETKIVRAGKTATTTAGNMAGKKSDFLILASDGLWDRISSDHAVECVHRYLAARDRGNGSVRNDPLLQDSPPASYATSASSSLDDGVTCDAANGQEVDWKATPEYFAIEDENAAVCLARNAMGGTRRGLFMGLMAMPEPWSRSALDDTTIMVVFFDEIGEGVTGQTKGGVAGTGEQKSRKRWWWPL
ncbi:phosphatase 2c [Pyrenophora seminiperda CCB06]|uniref:Phosphatase 2c n=1 Tax=Pyrenophora seminiperda CCB06 TaxID=1302712 RepID=A0A3M7LYR0_9PLEO|nr:phosphatase 2c [Pyrenophora seminiperda CCB06]